MRILNFIKRPEYFFRPSQVRRRLRRETIATNGVIRLAWGLPIEVNRDCHTGGDILNIGVFDRIIPEAIFRLLDTGETALDIGANIGQNASAMALAAGTSGRVIGFEPHPVLWDIFTNNVETWRDYDLAAIETVQLGLSDHSGTATLYEPDEFVGNMGCASLERPSESISEIEISLITLDEFLPQDSNIGLAKLDVEGHEASVLAGASRLLAKSRFRDVIFEDFHTQPSLVTTMLEADGFTVFSLFSPWLKPGLLPVREFLRRPGGFFTHNFLATRNPERAQKRFASIGWRCLRMRADRRIQHARRA